MNATARRQFAHRLEEERANLTTALREIEREVELDVIETAPERQQMQDVPSDAEIAEAVTKRGE
jgi:hypothetical protein